MRRGSNVPQAFRWRDDSGPVNMTGVDLRLRITLFDGTVLDYRAGVDPGFMILDQTDQARWGIFSFQPSLELTRTLPVEPAPHYEFEARRLGIEECIGEGQIVIRGGENPDG